jgi:hypothetical protein
MERICKRVGMFRWMPENWGVEAWTAPTLEQIYVLRSLFRQKEPILNLHRRGRRDFYREYEWYERGQALVDLMNFYEVGK